MPSSERVNILNRYASLICLVVFSPIGCNRADDKSNPSAVAPPIVKNDIAPLPPGQVPVPPLTIPEPKPLSATDGGRDITMMSENDLLTVAGLFSSQSRWASAAQYQYWAVKKSGQHQYNLACYLARCGQQDAAFYWLQVAAIQEGVDPEWAEEDGDLASLRADARWPSVGAYLRQCGKYWATNGQLAVTLILPKKYDGKSPITTIVGLHGLGSRPSNTVSDGLQGFADDLNVAFVGVSGTIPRGKSTFVWSEEPEDDHRQIVKALDSVKDRLTVKPGKVITFGFSQGRQAGLEAAVRHPEFYAGSIVMSPGNRTGSKLDSVKPSGDLSKRGFVFVVGAGEHPGNVSLTADNAKWARAAGAKVIHRPTPNQRQHTLPADFDERLPEWIKFIEDAGSK